MLFKVLFYQYLCGRIRARTWPNQIRRFPRLFWVSLEFSLLKVLNLQIGFKGVLFQIWMSQRGDGTGGLWIEGGKGVAAVGFLKKKCNSCAAWSLGQPFMTPSLNQQTITPYGSLFLSLNILISSDRSCAKMNILNLWMNLRWTIVTCRGRASTGRCPQCVLIRPSWRHRCYFAC